MNGSASSERYQRQVILPEIGLEGQQKLLAARVLVIGAGGLGCPVLLYLAAAGIGTIGIVDDDVVSLSNLHRQVLYDISDMGCPKAGKAAARLQQMNPDVSILPLTQRLTNQNALELFEDFDIVVDATDNFPSRYLINDACVLLGKPLVFGAVSRFEGQVSVFNVPRSDAERGIHYRDLFPVPPREGEVASCAEAGVIGVLPGIIGSLQAGEVIKLITGSGQTLAGQLQSFNLLSNEWFAWEISPNPSAEAELPRDRKAFTKTSYDLGCAVDAVSEIDHQKFKELLEREGVTVIDVRELGELPRIHEFANLQLPLSQLKEAVPEVGGQILIAVCQSGKRSRQAAQWIANAYPSKSIYSLKGGIAAWKQHQQTRSHD